MCPECPDFAVGDDLMPAAAAGRRYGVPDRTATRAFTAYADEQLADLDERQGPVEAAGVDEFRRGAPADRIDPETGEVTRIRSEWLTHLVDLDGGGTPGRGRGRTRRCPSARTCVPRPCTWWCSSMSRSGGARS